jgi:hypothetical protein
MARQAPIVDGNWTYVINTDPDVRIAQQPWALVKIDLRDEMTLEPVTSPTRVTSDHPEFTGVARSDGGAGLAVVPASVLSKLKTANYPGVISVDAQGYLPESRNFTILANPTFPDDFQPLDLGQWPLHRQPVAIYGRINLIAGGATTPVAGASVTMTKLWRRVPSPVLSPPPDPFTLVSLNPVLSAFRPVATTIVRRSLIPVASTFVLLSDLQPGTSSLLLSNTLGLAPGSLLAFDRLDLEHREIVAIASIGGSSGPGQPSPVQLRFPLAYRHFGVEVVALGVPGPSNTLGVPAIVGDRVALANSAAGIVSGNLVEINGGTAGAEYRTASVFSVLSDVRGFYLLPLLSRVGQIELTANDGVHTPVAQTVIPEYNQSRNRVDFILR